MEKSTIIYVFVAIIVVILIYCFFIRPKLDQGVVTNPPMPSAKTEIKLSVDAEALYNAPNNNTESVVLSHCTLSDNRSNATATGNGIPGFISPANKTKKVRWNIVEANSNNSYTLRIEQIQMKEGVQGNTDIFSKTIIAGKSGWVISTVDGQVPGQVGRQKTDKTQPGNGHQYFFADRRTQALR